MALKLYKIEHPTPQETSALLPSPLPSCFPSLQSYLLTSFIYFCKVFLHFKSQDGDRRKGYRYVMLNELCFMLKIEELLCPASDLMTFIAVARDHGNSRWLVDQDKSNIQS